MNFKANHVASGQYVGSPLIPRGDRQHYNFWSCSFCIDLFDLWLPLQLQVASSYIKKYGEQLSRSLSIMARDLFFSEMADFLEATAIIIGERTNARETDRRRRRGVGASNFAAPAVGTFRIYVRSKRVRANRSISTVKLANHKFILECFHTRKLSRECLLA